MNGLTTIHKKLSQCQAQSRFAGVSRLYFGKISCVLDNRQSVSYSLDSMDIKTRIFNNINNRLAHIERIKKMLSW